MAEASLQGLDYEPRRLPVRRALGDVDALGKNQSGQIYVHILLLPVPYFE